MPASHTNICSQFSPLTKMRSLTLVCILAVTTLVILEIPTATESALAIVRFKARPRQSLIPNPNKEWPGTQWIKIFSRWIQEIKGNLAKHLKIDDVADEKQELERLRVARLI